MTDTDRIIDAVADESFHAVLDRDTNGVEFAPPLTTATVSTALLGVCPECHRDFRRPYPPNVVVPINKAHLYRQRKHPQYPYECAHPYHDHRERMEAAK